VAGWDLSSMNSRFPLREARKAQTRSKLMQAAAALFTQQGYDATTLEEVADAAGLHVQTLYRHFPTKQDLATAGDQDLLEHFRHQISDPDRPGSTFAFWRGWVEQAADWVMRDGGENYRRYLNSSAGLPVVAVRLKAIQDQYEDLLTDSLEQECGRCDDLVSPPRLIAGMLLAGHNYVLRCHAREKIDLKAEALTVIRVVEESVGHLLLTRQALAGTGRD
jgi:AcrR family transcriptional regulator